MPDTALGLLIGLGIDATSAHEALRRFEEATGESFEGAARAPKSLDDALLSNRESVRLLGEEFSVHLPRAVSGAIAEMIPAIGALGPVLLGVFAVEEIPKLISGIREAAASWKGFGKEERAAMKKAIDDTGSLHAEVINVEKELALFGKTQAEQAALREKWAKEDADRAQDDLNKAQSKVDELNGKVKEAKKGADAFAAGAGSAYAGAIKVATAEVDKAREAWKLANDKALLAQRRAKEAVDAQSAKERDDSERSAEKYVHQEESRLSRLAEFNKTVAREYVEAVKRNERVDAEMAAEHQKTLHEMIEGEKRWDRIVKEDAKLQAEALKEVDRALRQLPASLSALGGTLPQVLPKLNEWQIALHNLTHAQDGHNKSLASNIAFVAQNAASILDTLG